MSSIALAAPGMGLLPRDRITRWLEQILIYGSIILIPYDLPVVHQACIPLAFIAACLMVLRQDLRAFLGFVRQFSAALLCVMIVAAFGLASIYMNIGTILSSVFQDETGWRRATLQGTLLLITLWYPFYLSFCLSRQQNWQAMIRHAAWLSLPIPLMVGVLQVANIAGVPGLSHLPYITVYEGGFTRVTSVARESSWFGSFSCVVLPFLIYDIATRLQGVRKWIGICAVGVLLLIFFLGFSKSAYAALAMEGGVGFLLTMILCRPWRTIKKLAFAVLVASALLFLTAILSSNVFERITKPFLNAGITVYGLFEPLILGDTKFISIGTRFGMSAAGTAMGESHPIFGVGLGQFGFHAQTFLPLWGLNGETQDWISSDSGEWPSTSNLYTRLFAEIGMPGAYAYIVFRALIMLWLIAHFFRAKGQSQKIDALIICSLGALVAFDFHRDSFINLDMWADLSLAMACIASWRAPAGATTGLLRIFGGAALVSLVIAMTTIATRPLIYRANATVLAKSIGIEVQAASMQESRESFDDNVSGVPLSISPVGTSNLRFDMFQSFWGSRLVAERLIARDPRLVKAVLGVSSPVSPRELAQYMNRNLSIVTADHRQLASLSYENGDPHTAIRFLSAAIEETDRVVASVAVAAGNEASELVKLASDSNLDSATRQIILQRAAALELQSQFDSSGRGNSFDYIERPAVSAAPQLRAVAALLLALVLALLTAAAISGSWMLWNGADR